MYGNQIKTNSRFTAFSIFLVSTNFSSVYSAVKSYIFFDTLRLCCRRTFIFSYYIRTIFLWVIWHRILQEVCECIIISNLMIRVGQSIFYIPISFILFGCENNEIPKSFVRNLTFFYEKKLGYSRIKRATGQYLKISSAI